MRKTGYVVFGAPRLAVVAVSVALVVALVWAAAAQAQSPTEDQYGGPRVPSGPALGPSGVAVEDGSTAGGAAGGGTATSGNAADTTQQPADPAATGFLPATGGVTLLAYAGAIAASGAGLVLLRRSGRGE